jgi:TIR domain/Pentapeptide repeats (8 copies)
MANEEHLARLKQGAEVWNRWRAENPTIRPNLFAADLIGAHLPEADLSGAHFSTANLSGAHLPKADLSGADLTGARLIGAHLPEADLTEAHLTGADLSNANLTGAHLTGVHLSKAEIGWTTFGDIDLSRVRGLETVRHLGPSTMGIDTLYRSHGNIPEVFLRGADVPDDMITYSKSLVGQPFQYDSCFISYSSHDEALAQRLHTDLRAHKVRCWFAPEDLKIGDEFRSRIDESIQVYDRLLLILSEHSVTSRWVQKEVETAFEKEGKENRIVLFPIRIDEAVIHSAVGWAADIRRQRHIGDFRQWKDHDAYQQTFQRLLRDLKADI